MDKDNEDSVWLQTPSGFGQPSGPLPAGMVAAVDQLSKGVEDSIRDLLADHVALIVAEETGDEQWGALCVHSIGETTAALDRSVALSILSTLAAGAARRYVDDEGGAMELMRRVKAGKAGQPCYCGNCVTREADDNGH